MGSRFFEAALVLVAVGLGLQAGCNRVPSGSVPRPPAAVKASQRALTVAQEQAPLEPLCGRACNHWVDLKFPDPIGYDRLAPQHAQRIREILERQRALNLASCEEACVAAKDRSRARCVLRAGTASECAACVYR